MRLNGMQRAGLVGGLGSGLALAVALLSERWGGLVPCALCLVERWPYRAAVLLCMLAVVSRRWSRLGVGLAAVAMLASAGAAAVHVGVEQGWWPSPLPECAAPVLGGGTMAERLARMPARPAKPCDEPTYLVPGLGVSMAAMNLLLSVMLAGGLGLAAVRAPARRMEVLS